jgi:hypothetical protein
MSETSEHNIGDHEDPLPGPTWIVGLLGVVLLVVIGMGLTALYYNAMQHEDTKKFVDPDPGELVNLRTAQLARLGGTPHWEQSKNADGKDVKALIIPIDQAMQKVVQDFSQKK